MPALGKIVLASRNDGKVREIAEVLGGLGVEVVGLGRADPHAAIASPAETGATFAANARAKALYYARATGLWALADDSGLMVDALGGAPGVHSARYAADDLPAGSHRGRVDAANNAKLLRELADVPDEMRSARFVCHLALSEGRRIVLEAAGVFDGRIGRVSRGSNGFGYDPLFIPAGLARTVAEMAAGAKNEISHRGLAAREFARRLAEMLAGGEGAGR